MAAAIIKKADAEDKNAADDARAWKKELQLAAKREKDWQDQADKIVKRYRGEDKKRNRFNVLWSNTEILRPAVYNTKPQPDVRRRFRDSDPTGKAVSEVLERALTVFIDGYDVECAAKNDVLDALLPGRGLSRLRYVPKITSIPPKEAKAEGNALEDRSVESAKTEEVEYEEVLREHVDWRDFRHGYGRVWEEVPWEGFRHKLTRKEAEEKFGKAPLNKIKFTAPVSDDVKKPGDEVNETQKVAEFWEIWDKIKKQVFFVNEQADNLLYTKDNQNGEPPLEFPDFWPNPEPLKLIENTGSTIAIPHFSLYQNQADELDRISARIDKVVAVMKLRGIYDSKLVEIPDVMTADDNELTPIQNAAAYLSVGGLEKAISWMPIEQCVKVLEALYDARERQKVIIDELTGISDIIRGVTDANETYGAQQLKSNYASVRLQRMQKEVQRYERDMLRLASHIMCSKFDISTFASMTDLKFPTAQEKAQLMHRAQMAQQPPMLGMPPPQPVDPTLLKIPSWDEIAQLLKSPTIQQYRVDIETDSTIAGMLESDMAGLREVLTGISEVLTGMAPLVQSQALPVDAAKEVVMAVVRRARLGLAVEDAFDKMKAPVPPPPPPDHSVEVAQIKAQSDQQIAQLKIQSEGQSTVVEHQAIAQTEQAKQALEAQRHTAEAQMKAELEAANKAHAAAIEQMRLESSERIKALELENARVIADADNQTKLMIAEIQANQAAALQQQKIESDQTIAKMQGDNASELQDKKVKADQEKAEAPTAAAYKGVEQSLAPVLKELVAHLKTPKRVMRDENGKIVGVQ